MEKIKSRQSHGLNEFISCDKRLVHCSEHLDVQILKFMVLKTTSGLNNPACLTHVLMCSSVAILIWQAAKSKFLVKKFALLWNSESSMNFYLWIFLVQYIWVLWLFDKPCPVSIHKKRIFSNQFQPEIIFSR